LPGCFARAALVAATPRSIDASPLAGVGAAVRAARRASLPDFDEMPLAKLRA
jgi:hypothetical protein